MVDAATGQRGFLLTDDSDYLAPYLDAERRIPETIANLKAALRDDPQETQEVDRLTVLLTQAFDLLALDHHLPSGTVRPRDPHDTERDPGAYFRDRGRASPSLHVTGRALGRDIGVSREPAARSRGEAEGSRARVERAAERRADPGVDRQGGVDRRDGDRARHQRFQVRLSGGRGRRNPRPLSQQRRPQGRPRGGRRRHRLDRGGNAAGDRPRVAHRQCARPRAQRLAQLRARPGLPRDVRD
jgi:hypothetical protein